MSNTELSTTGGVLLPGWEECKLKYLISGLESGVSVNAADVPASESQIGVLKTSCVSTGQFRASENKAVFLEETDRVSCPVREGEIIISRMNTPRLVGASAIVFYPIERLFLPDRLWQTISGFREICANRFLVHLLQLRWFRDQISMLAEGASASMQSLSREDFINLKVCFPKLEDQLSIASFVDCETARIDTLIAKQKQLIELLKEKRQAVISQLVTKGLDPDVPMKDSGVEWLGEVPEHWSVVPIKWRLTKLDQGWSPQCENRLPDQHEYGVLKVGAVNGGVFRASESKALPASESPKLQYLIRKNDLLISRANTRDLVGSAAVVGSDSNSLMLCDKLYRVHLSQKLVPRFVACYLNSPVARASIEIDASGASSSMLNIGQSTLKDLSVPMPPVSEQTEILAFLDAVDLRLNDLIAKATEATDLLNERRIALISAAVTGQIDITTYAPSGTTATPPA